MLTRGKHSSLLRKSVNYEKISFIISDPDNSGKEKWSLVGRRGDFIIGPVWNRSRIDRLSAHKK